MTHYARLQIMKNASLAEIKVAYRKLALIYHPDRTGGNAEKSKIFVEITQAYNTLIDPRARLAYDESIREAPTQQHAQGTKAQSIPRPKNVWQPGRMNHVEPKPVNPLHFNEAVWNHHHYGDPMPETVKLKSQPQVSSHDSTTPKTYRVITEADIKEHRMKAEREISSFIKESNKTKSKEKNNDPSTNCIIQ